MIDNSKIIQRSLPLPEGDDDEQSFVDIIEDNFQLYQQQELIDNIGEKEFRDLYLNFISDIKQLSLNDQRVFCKYLYEKVNEVYQFSFLKLSLETLDDMNQFYKFIEFIEFDYVEFVVDIIQKLNLDINNIILPDSIDIINTQVKYQNPLINDFISEVDKETLNTILHNMIYKNKSEILINMKISKIL